MVSFAVPSISKIRLDLKLKVIPVRTKPRGDEMENVLNWFPVLEENPRLHLPNAFCFGWGFFPSMEKSPCGLGLRGGFSLHALPQQLRSAEALK